MFSYSQLRFPSHTEKNTRFLVIAGFSFAGPSGRPFVIREDVDPVNVLGQSRMAEDVKKARTYGINPMVMRLNGEHGECIVRHATEGRDFLRFTTIDATDEANNIEVRCFPTHLVIRGLQSNKAYYFADYPRADALVRHIQEDLYLGGGEVSCELIEAMSMEGICIEEAHIPMTGADDGYNAMVTEGQESPEQKIANQAALFREAFIEGEGEGMVHFGELNPFQVDTLLLSDIPYEEAPEELIEMIGTYAYTKTREQALFCSVVMASHAFTEGRFDSEGNDLFLSQIERLTEKNLSRSEAAYMQHIEVVVGATDSNNLRQPYDLSASDYAFMRYRQADLAESGTNKKLEHVNTLYSAELQKDEVANLIGSGYICIVPSIRRGAVAAKSQNLYPHYTLAQSPHVMRSVHYDTYRIAGFFADYLGSIINDATFQQIYGRAQTFVAQLKDKHKLYRDVELAILDYSEKEVVVSLQFYVYGEIESVRSSFAYTPSGEVIFA